MSQQIRQLGQTYLDIRKWSLLSIFFFWLIFPVIVLLIKQFQLSSDMKTAGQAHNDQQLIAFGDRELLIIILNLVSSPTGGITGIVALVLEFIQLGELKEWAVAHNLPNASEGYGSMRTGLILVVLLGWLIIPLIIGIVMIFNGYKTVGEALLV